MPKTRREISADARARKKENVQKLLSKYVPANYHATINEMLGDFDRLPEILIYYKKLINSRGLYFLAQEQNKRDIRGNKRLQRSYAEKR